MPEFKNFEKALNEGVVLQSMFCTTMGNLIDQMPNNAIFFADKLRTLTFSDPIIIYLLGEAFFLNGNFKKIYFTFDKHDLLYKNDNYLVLVAKGLLRVKEYKLCQELIQTSLESK